VRGKNELLMVEKERNDGINSRIHSLQGSN
jgi:hypothetical protein